MNKLKMHTPNRADENFEKLAALFPNAVTETKDENGAVVRAIDKDVLMQEINTRVVDGKDERYQFTWPDKKKSVLLANAPINKTLRPCREESVDFDKTENLYIEGDNLEVLKLLQETYLGKIKMIYIDPPYNTGNDFVYEDDFRVASDKWSVVSGEYDEDGNRLFQNTESNGRFHTDWLNMIYPRLKLAKDLLTDDGVIFISIGDDEVGNLIKIGNELFGEKNFIANICHKSRASVSNDRIISENHNHLLFYTKDVDLLFRWHKQIGDDPKLEGFNLVDDNGRYKLVPVDGPGGAKKGNPFYEFNGITGYWRYSKATMQEKFDKGLIVVTDKNLQQKYYLNDAKNTRQTVTTWWDKDFLTSNATRELIGLMGGQTFDNPKNVNLLLRCLKMITYAHKNSIILDFFSGSATTAHAVMQLNAEDGGNRKFIMVQLPEACDEKSEAYKAGYKNICEIGKERIRRAGKKVVSDKWLVISDKEKAKYGCKELSRSACLAEINGSDENDLFATRVSAVSGDCQRKQGGVGDTTSNMCDEWTPCPYGHFGTDGQTSGSGENAECPYKNTAHCPLTTNHSLPDIGFRVLKCDTSNMKDVYYTPDQLSADSLFDYADNIKEDRSPEDLLFQVMLDLGVLLSSKIDETTIGGKKVFSVADGFLMACFDKDVTDEVITAIAKKKPYYFVMRDSSLASDSVATNFDQIFATYSPDTVRKVL